MSIKVDPLNLKIRAYLKENPEYLNSNYDETAKKFKVTSEKVRHQARAVRDELKSKSPTEVSTQKDTSFTENIATGEATYSFTTPKRIKTLQDLIDLGMLNLTDFEISSYEVTTWEGYRAGKTTNMEYVAGVGTGKIGDTGQIVTETLYRVAVKLKRKTVQNDLVKQKQIILDELKSIIPSIKPKETLSKLERLGKDFLGSVKDCALEINIPDLHLGKLAHADESGEDYDMKIAVKRYKEAIASLISRTPIHNLKKIILVVGHDFLNVDGKNNMTTAGTPQTSDSRFYKMVQVGKKLLIETINDLSSVVPVDVIVVAGNHDSNSMLMVGDILEAYYWNNSDVYIHNTPAPRKYYQFGVNGNMYTHGHNEKINDLPIIFATENPDLWQATSRHRVHLGHFHHNKQIRVKDIEENHGCVVKIINSLSSDDAWHSEKGFLSNKAAEAFLYHETNGLIANYYFYI